MTPPFVLHERLARDCFQLGRFPLCRLLLMNDSAYPWFILVPERAGIGEIFQLAEADRLQLLRESSDLAAALSGVYRPDKLNIAAIGNLVPQLHLHHVVRYRKDRAWPGVIWGRFDPVPYGGDPIDARLGALLGCLPEFEAEP
ncbi:MAG: HIT domain-containing protein [Methylococcus sp.]|nr:HIT domain-containing protein [Methylococcus sp.]